MTRTKRQKELSRQRFEQKKSLKQREKMGCPHLEKNAFASKRDAESALYATWRRMGRTRYAVRVYHCKCGFWHLTSKPLNPDRQPSTARGKKAAKKTSATQAEKASKKVPA